MDLGHIPALAYEFYTAASATAGFALHYGYEAAANLTAGLLSPEAMTPAQKAFQLAKFAGAAVCLAASVVEKEPAGVIGSVMAGGDVIADIEEAGEKVRHTNAPQPPAQ